MSHESSDERVRLILSHVSPTDEVLDIGSLHSAVQSGIGVEETVGFDDWLYRFLREKAASVVGLDINAAGVEKLRGLGYDVRLGDAESFQLNRQFDCVIARDVIEHLQNPGALLQNVHAHLRRGGKFILTTPNPWWLRNLMRASRGDVVVNPEHICWYDRFTLVNFLRRAGYEADSIALVRPSRGTRGFLTANALWRLGFCQIAAQHLLIVARAREKIGPRPDTDYVRHRTPTATLPMP